MDEEGWLNGNEDGHIREKISDKCNDIVNSGTITLANRSGG